MFCIISVMGQTPDIVAYKPHNGSNSAIINTQIARMIPKVLNAPSALLEANRIKNPTIVNTVAGNRLKIKHIIITSFQTTLFCCSFRAIQGAS